MASKSSWFRLAPVLLLLVVVTLAACGSASPGSDLLQQDPFAFPLESVAEKWWLHNPCGWLDVRKPLLNVSGRVSASLRPNSSIFLLIAPNTSITAALNTVRNCAPLGRARVDTQGGFSFGGLPVGDYFAVLPISAFEEVQGFPVVREYNTSSHSVRMLWHGGDAHYSIAAFQVVPRET